MNQQGTKLKEFRRDFTKLYGKTTAQVLTLIQKGKSSTEIAKKLNLPKTSVATYKGNYSREFYYPYAYRDVNNNSSGVCTFWK